MATKRTARKNHWFESRSFSAKSGKWKGKGEGKRKVARKSLGKKLDSALFGIQHNPAAKRRKLYQAGYVAGRKKPGDPSAALTAAQRTALFKEAAAGDVNAAKEFFLAGYQDGMERGNPGEFAKCVGAAPGKKRAVCKKRNPSSVSVDGRVVFTGNIQEVTALAARLKSEGLKVTSAPAAKGSKMGWRKNPATNPATKTLQEAYAGFHGEPSEETLRFQERYHYHKHTWTLGPLVYLKVWLPSDRRQPGLRNFAEIKFDYEAKIPVLVTANEKRNQMFFERGDQSVDLKVFDVPPEPHETVVLGEVSDAYYFTTKKHLGNQGGTAIYKHKLGEEGGELPMLLYHPLEKRLSLAGGSYTIPDEGVRN